MQHVIRGYGSHKLTLARSFQMKVANKKPAPVKSPVRVTADKYELWYARPVLLGLIEKQSNYWVTQDGVRFVSSRAALDYLAKVRDFVETELQVDRKYVEKVGTAPVTTSSKRPTQPTASQLDNRRTTVIRASVKNKKIPTLLNEEIFHQIASSLGYIKTSPIGDSDSDQQQQQDQNNNKQ